MRFRHGYELKLETVGGQSLSLVNSMLRFNQLETILQENRPDLWPNEIEPKYSPQVKRNLRIAIVVLAIMQAALFIYLSTRRS